MNNVLFFLTPKAMCKVIFDDYTVRQALEKMETAGYTSMPILSHQGEYRGTLTEGDLLWALKNMCNMDIRQAEAKRIMDNPKKKKRLYGLIWACAGAVLTGVVWLLTIFL